MRDKVAVVRFYAAEAASRLINPDDPRDRVTAQYIAMLETDPSRCDRSACTCAENRTVV
jgi:hypothetical protein